MELSVKSKNHSYNITIKSKVFSKTGSILKSIVALSKVFVVTDENVYNLYGEKLESMLRENGIKYGLAILPPGEKTKSEKYLFKLYESFVNEGISRHDYIVAFGGGVIGDLTGFAASTYLRGVKYIQIPTTLLAQVDSSVGGKCAIDLPQGKNLVGSFYPPCSVIIDPHLLKTLSKKDFSCGMAEVIKYGAIYDENLFNSLLNDDITDKLDDIIYRCVDIKREIVELDEFDTGKRMILNFGHTYGHILESYYNYEKYTHGEAVGLGMLYITKITELMGLTEEGTLQKLKLCLEKYGISPKEDIISKKDGEKILNLDKKGDTQSISYVIINKIGKSDILKIKKEDSLLWKN